MFIDILKNNKIRATIYLIVFVLLWPLNYNGQIIETKFLNIKTDGVNISIENTSSISSNNEIIKTDVHYMVDYDYLKKVAPNAVGFLLSHDNKMNQVVVYSEDPKYYMSKGYNGRSFQYGTLFITGTQFPNVNSPLLTIHGKNNQNNNLFGSLSLYKEQEYYNNNSVFYLLTPNGDFQLDIFAGIKQKVNNFEDWKEPKNIHTFFNNDLSRLIKESIFKPKIENIPVVGDSIVMLASDNMKQEGNRYILYAKKRPIIYNSDNVQYVNKMEMDNRKTYNKTVTLSTLGDIIIYAQNDPLWGNLIYEVDYSDKRRRFKDGACGPVAVATVVANLVDKEDLPKIKDYALNDEGFSFCSCSVNQYWCSKNHIRYIINTPDEFLRYLPIVIGNFSTGNNIWNRSGRSDRYGTSLNYLGNICEIYDINIHKVQNVFEAIEKLKAGKTLAIASVTSASAFTDNSHFIVLVGVDDKYLYVIDPLRRDTYMPKDERKLLDIMTPGLVRIKLEDVYKCGIFSIFILDKNPPMMQEEIHIPYN